MDTKIDRAVLLDIIDRAGETPEPYSGRGMSGEECLSFTTKAAPMRVAADMLDAASACGIVWIECLSAALRAIKTDNMGHETIYYFPGVSP